MKDNSAENITHALERADRWEEIPVEDLRSLNDELRGLRDQAKTALRRAEASDQTIQSLVSRMRKFTYVLIGSAPATMLPMLADGKWLQQFGIDNSIALISSLVAFITSIAARGILDAKIKNRQQRAYEEHGISETASLYPRLATRCESLPLHIELREEQQRTAALIAANEQRAANFAKLKALYEELLSRAGSLGTEELNAFMEKVNSISQEI